MANAIAASAVARRERMAASLASGKRWCPSGGGHWSAVTDFGSSPTSPSGLRGYCRLHTTEYARTRRAAKRAAAAEAARTATRAATQARVYEAERARWAGRDPAPAVALDAETRTLVVAIRWRLGGVGDADALAIARLVVPGKGSQGAARRRALDRVETFAGLADAEAAALAQRAGVELPEPQAKRRRRRAA